MKLIACHIENFGRLHACDFDFSHNPTSIFAPNGWGKSTLAAFLKSMFYGLPDCRVKSAESNARLKYKPWQGGVYGGSLTFEFGGRRYEVKRLFSDGAKGDDCKIYDAVTGLIATEFFTLQESLGERLFGVDEKGYEKLAYLPQDAVESRLDGGLQAALLRSQESLDGGEDVEGAVAAIEAEEKWLRAKRKPAKGRLDVLDEEIFALEKEIFEGKEAETICAKYERTLAELDAKIEESRKERTRAYQERQTEQGKLSNKEVFLWAVAALLFGIGLTGIFIPNFPWYVSLILGLVGGALGVVLFVRRKKNLPMAGSAWLDGLTAGEGWENRLFAERQQTLLAAQPYFAAGQKLGVLQEELQRKREEKRALERRAQDLSTAKSLLIEAKRRTAGDYLQPLTERCRALFTKFYPQKAIVLTAEGEVRLDEAGALREGAYYSAGMRAALGICIRLALIETLFKREFPPLILDDPFVDMDEENMRLAKGFLQALQKEYQIVYLTCHESRLL